MDCQTAQQHFDLLRPNSGDRELPELAAAESHLQSCTACQATVELHQAWDSAIGDAVRDVPVPPDLKEQLLTALTRQEAAGGDNSIDGTVDVAQVLPNSESSRRRWLQMTVTAAAVVVAAIGIWRFVRPAVEELTVEKLTAWSTGEMGSFKPFDDSFAVPDPNLTSFPAPSRSTVLGKPLGVGVESRHQVAVFPLTVSMGRGRVLRGVLLVVPEERVAAPPAANLFSASAIDYPHGVPTVMWRERGFVYVCSIRDGADTLTWLQSQQVPAA